MNHRNIIF